MVKFPQRNYAGNAVDVGGAVRLLKVTIILLHMPLFLLR